MKMEERKRKRRRPEEGVELGMRER